jgi:hypothetical protein
MKVKKHFATFLTLYLLLAAIIVVWVASYILIKANLPEAKRGPFGDTFGAVNSLFSGLAFSGLIYTIHLQRRELSLQRRELRQTRGELQTQNETSKRQQFENTFFKLLDSYNVLTNTFNFRNDSQDHVNKKFFEYLLSVELDEKKYRLWLVEGHEVAKEHDYYSLGSFYGEIYLKHESYLRPWLGTIEKILHHVDRSGGLSNSQRAFYVSILRSQLTSYEMILVGFHVMTRVLEHRRLATLVTKYKVLVRDNIFPLKGLFYEEFVDRLESAFVSSYLDRQDDDDSIDDDWE